MPSPRPVQGGVPPTQGGATGLSPGAPTAGGVFRGLGGFVAFTGLDYVLNRAMGGNASIWKSVGSGLMWNFLGAVSPALGTAMIVPELMSLYQGFKHQRIADRAIYSMHHVAGRIPATWHASMYNLQETGLRRIMANRRALGMAFGSEASFMHRA